MSASGLVPKLHTTRVAWRRGCHPRENLHLNLEGEIRSPASRQRVILFSQGTVTKRSRLTQCQQHAHRCRHWLQLWHRARIRKGAYQRGQHESRRPPAGTVNHKQGYHVHAVDLVDGDGLKALSSIGAKTHELDVTSTDSIHTFKQSIGDEPIDLLLNIAGPPLSTYARLASQGHTKNFFLLTCLGVATPPEHDNLETTTLSTFEKTFAVNTYGPMFVTQALLPNILGSHDKKIGILTSRVGSVGDNSTGGSYAYRSSKAAANSVGKSMAMNLKDQGVTVMLLHPGIVLTNILPDISRNKEAVQPEEAAMKLWKNVVSQKGVADTGKFWHREGQELLW